MWQVIGHHSCRAKRQLVKRTAVQVTPTWQWSSWNHNKNIWIICGHNLSLVLQWLKTSQTWTWRLIFVDVGPTLLGWFQILAFDFSRKIRILVSIFSSLHQRLPHLLYISYLFSSSHFFSLSSFSPASYFVRFSREKIRRVFCGCQYLIHWLTLNRHLGVFHFSGWIKILRTNYGRLLFWGKMKIQCDVCEKAPATVICCADEAALCAKCDFEVHAANKLASKHQRLHLQCLSNKLPKCDICQVILLFSLGFLRFCFLLSFCHCWTQIYCRSSLSSNQINLWNVIYVAFDREIEMIPKKKKILYEFVCAFLRSRGC